MDFVSCKYPAQFEIAWKSQNMSVIPYATFFIDYGLNMTATGHVDATIRISDVTQPLNFGVFNRVPKQLLKGEGKFILNVAEEARLGDLGNLLLPLMHLCWVN